MATFGDLERALADLYPYRWAIGAVVLVLIAAFFAFAWWRGWHLWAWRYRKPIGIVSVPLFLVTLWLGWSLGSPLFTNVTVDEAFPFAAAATVPEDMEREEVEQILSGFSKVDTPVMETMPAPGVIDASAAMAAGQMDMEDAPVVMTPRQRAAMEEGMSMAMEASVADTMEEASSMTQEAVAMMQESIEESMMSMQSRGRQPGTGGGHGQLQGR